MGSEVVGAEAVEAFEADKQSFGMRLLRWMITGSRKQRTH